MPANDFLALREPLASVMHAAGDIARATARGPFKHWTKGADRSPVTEADIAVNEFLRERLSGLVSEAGWKSEESPADQPNNRAVPLVWIVDPIDGTRAFISGRADWSISVALVEHGRPLIATIYAPITDEMFLAVRGQGAWLNSMPIKVSTSATLAGASLAGPKRFLDRLSAINPGIVAQPKVHSLALRIARVAHGALDAAFASGGSHDWDLAAADLLVHEAGGALTDFAGRPLTYDEPEAAYGALIAAGPARHAALIELVRDHETEFA